MILPKGLSSWLWIYYIPCSSASIVDFEDVMPAGII